MFNGTLWWFPSLLFPARNVERNQRHPAAVFTATGPQHTYWFVSFPWVTWHLIGPLLPTPSFLGQSTTAAVVGPQTTFAHYFKSPLISRPLLRISSRETKMMTVANSSESERERERERERVNEWMNKLYFTRVVEKTRSFYRERERERENEWMNE